jgi:chaperone modulatory protein CbpM
MVSKQTETLQTVALEDQLLSLLDLCRAIGAPAEPVIEMIEYGVVEPSKGKSAKNWQFTTYAIKRTRVALHLQRDLHINLDGLGLALDLLEEVQDLRRRVQFLEHHFKD